MSERDPALQTRSADGIKRRIAANTGLLLGAKILATTLGAATFWVATQALTPVAFGTLVFLHAYMLFFAEVATFQAWQSIIRFGTDDVAEGNRPQLAKLLRFGFTLDLVSVLFGYALAFLAFGLVVRFADYLPGLTTSGALPVGDLRRLAVLYCLVILLRFTSTSIGIFRLFDKFVVLGAEALIKPVIRFSGAMVSWSQGWGLEAFLVVWFIGSFAQYTFLWSAGLWELKRRGLLGDVLRARVNFFRPGRPIWGFVIKSNIDSTLATSFMNLPQLLVMPIFGPVWNGVFKIAEEVAKLLTEGFKLLDQVIYPELAKLVNAGRASEIWPIVVRAAAILLSIGVAFSVLVFLFGEPVLARVFGEEYGRSIPLLALLVPAAALMGAAAPLYPIFYAVDRPGRAIIIRGAALIVYLATFFIAAATVGKLAPGFASLASNSFAVIVLAFAAKRALDASNPVVVSDRRVP